MKKIYLAIFLLPVTLFSQSNLESILKSSEIIVSGLSILKGNKTNNSKVATVCVKNKLLEKINFSLLGKDADDKEIIKELVIPNDGKECVFDIPKAVYAYKIVLSNNEVFRQGEYKFDDDVTITIKKDN